MNVADLIALVGILVALTALIYQMRQYTVQLRLQTFMAYTERYQQIMLELPSTIESDSFDLQSLCDDEREKTLRWLRAYFDLCSEEFHLWQTKRIENSVWEKWNAGIRDSLSKPAYAQAWREIQKHHYYPSESYEFIKYVERTLQASFKTPSP